MFAANWGRKRPNPGIPLSLVGILIPLKRPLSQTNIIKRSPLQNPTPEITKFLFAKFIYDFRCVKHLLIDAVHVIVHGAKNGIQIAFVSKNLLLFVYEGFAQNWISMITRQE